MTAELQDEFAQYRRSLSSGPLLGRSQQQSWVRRVENKLRNIYAAITCTRSSDVVHHRPATRQDPRPRLTPQTTMRPPPPDQAGGSSWQPQTTMRPPPPEQPSFYYGHRPSFDQQHQPFLYEMGWRPQMTEPHEQHQSATSGYTWGSDHQPESNMEDYTTQSGWGIFPPDPTQQTPPPYTQETQHEDPQSFIPPRNIRPPNRLGWSSQPRPPPREPRPRHGRGRQI